MQQQPQQPQQPLDYERPPRGRKQIVRVVFGRLVVGAWLLFLAAFVFGLFFGADDRSSLQWPAAIFAGFSLMGALALTAFHWLVLVPVLWFRNRRTAPNP